jgi:small subunit ribosomal protein S7
MGVGGRAVQPLFFCVGPGPDKERNEGPCRDDERYRSGRFEVIEKKTRNDPLAMFRRALDNIRPRVEVKSRRVGGATYQVPIEVRPERANSLAMRWLSSYARNRAGKSMHEKLADEIIDAANERGESVKKREDTHRMAEANKAFSHYRW